MHRAVFVGLISLCACAARPVEEDAGTTTMIGSSSTTSTQEESSEVGPLTLTVGTTQGDGDGDPEGDGDADGSSEVTDGDGDGDPSGDGDGDDCMEPIKLDIPPDFENIPAPLSCTVEEIEWGTLAIYPDCELCFDFCHALFLGCATPAPGQTCADICPSGDCISGNYELCTDGWIWYEMEDTCGHYEIDGQCCSVGKAVSCIAE